MEKTINYVIENLEKTGMVTGLELTNDQLNEMIEEVQVKRGYRLHILEGDDGNIFDIYSI